MEHARNQGCILCLASFPTASKLRIHKTNDRAWRAGRTVGLRWQGEGWKIRRVHVRTQPRSVRSRNLGRDIHHYERDGASLPGNASKACGPRRSDGGSFAGYSWRRRNSDAREPADGSIGQVRALLSRSPISAMERRNSVAEMDEFLYSSPFQVRDWQWSS